MNQKIAKWAERTLQVYLDIIEKKGYDVEFYQQTPLRGITERPDVVVMGINPGSGGTYSDQKINKKWNMDGKNATAQHLLNGNVYWNDEKKDHNTWGYIRNVKALLQPTFSKIIDDDKSIVFTNATFFATSKAKDLNGEVMKTTLPCTINLIDILNPKMAICLSGQNLFQKIKQSKPTFDYENVYDSKLLVGKLNEVTYIGIPHTASWYSRPLKRLVSKAIKLVNDNREKSLKEIVSIVQDNCRQEWQDVCDYKPITSHRYEEAQEIIKIIANHFDQPVVKDTVTIPVNNIVKIVFVAQKSQQYIYCRHYNFKDKEPYTTHKKNYEHSDEIMNILSSFKYETEDYSTALGKKPLSHIATADNSEENAQRIINEINGIIKEFNLKI